MLGADVIALTDATVGPDLVQGPHMIRHMDPVPYLIALPVDGERALVQGAVNHVGNEFVRILVGAVVICGMGQDDRGLVGTVPSAYQMIAGRLAGRVRRAGQLAGLLLERGLVIEPQIPIYLIGRNMNQTKSDLLFDR